MNLRRLVATGAAVILAATGLAACSSDSDSAEDTIRIGSTDSAKTAWQVFADQAEAQGIHLDVVDYADYNTPNDALKQGQLDVNLFQHLKFLANYNVGTNSDLTPVGATEIIPLALFWKDHDSLDGIDGQSVAIPNDSTNQGRAINVLVQAGLVTLRNTDVLEPTPADIDTDASRVSVTPVDAAQSTVSYGEGTPAIINNSFLNRAGIDPKSSVFQDDPSSKLAEPYINVFVTTPEKATDERIQKLVEIWHSPEVQAANDKDSAGTSVEVQRTPEELENILTTLEDDIRAHQ